MSDTVPVGEGCGKGCERHAPLEGRGWVSAKTKQSNVTRSAGEGPTVNRFSANDPVREGLE